jgi:hypothetical protein
MASAMRAGLQMRKTKVTLASQDSGTGRLTAWYKNMGFTRIGLNERGYPVLEAPISRGLSGVAQAHLHVARQSDLPGRRRTGLGVSVRNSGVVQRANRNRGQNKQNQTSYQQITGGLSAWTNTPVLKTKCLNYCNGNDDKLDWLRFAYIKNCPPPELGHGSQPGGGGTEKDELRFALFRNAMAVIVDDFHAGEKGRSPLAKARKVISKYKSDRGRYPAGL